MFFRTFIFSIMFLTSACASMFSDKLYLEETSYDSLPNWQEDEQISALKAFIRSCPKMKETNFFGKKIYWQEVCNKAPSYAQSNKLAREFFEKYFVVFEASNKGNKEGLFTGYYEITLNGSYQKDDKYRYPVYKKPYDLVAGNRYFSRKQIDQGAIAHKNLEILWVDDPVRLFFLHVQGSGQIKLPDGQVVKLGYAGKNGRDYVSIGKYMIEKGLIDKENMSAQAIWQYMYNNPEEAQKIMWENPSYVFFKQLDTKSPIGAQGVELTAERSVAIDNKHIPYGVPIWLDLTLSDSTEDKEVYYQRLVIAQDTGAAIKGPVRGDVFFGAGDRAEKLAGYKKSIGKYYLFIPRNQI